MITSQLFIMLIQSVSLTMKKLKGTKWTSKKYLKKFTNDDRQQTPSEADIKTFSSYKLNITRK